MNTRDALKKARERIRQGKAKLEDEARRIRKSTPRDADREPSGKLAWPKDELSLIREIGDDKKRPK